MLGATTHQMSVEYHAGSHGKLRESADQVPDQNPAGFHAAYNPPGSWTHYGAKWQDYDKDQETTRQSDLELPPMESTRSSASSDLEPPSPNSSEEVGPRPRSRRAPNYIKWPPNKFEFFKKWAATEWEPWLQSMPNEGPNGFAYKGTKLEWLDWYLACRAHCRIQQWARQATDQSSSTPVPPKPDPVMDDLTEEWELSLTLSGKRRRSD